MNLRAAAVLLLPLVLGCVEEPTAPAALLYGCAFGPAGTPEAGEVTTAIGDAAQSLCLDGGPEGAHFVFIPFYAARSGTVQLNVEVTGGGFAPSSAKVAHALEPRATLTSASAGPRLAGPSWSFDDRFHHGFLWRESRELTPRIRSGAIDARDVTGSRPDHAPRSEIAQQPVPEVGSLLELNVSIDCEVIERVTGRVGAVTDRAIVVADTANPPSGFDDTALRSFGVMFDTLIHPLAQANFGAPTDIDENGHVIIFFTRAVNELTPPDSEEFTAGFFWAGDLFPTVDTPRLEACPSSNQGEMFYVLAPDPDGAVNDNPRSVDFVRDIAVRVIAHEYQHLINASRRIFVNNASAFEDVWLNEGLSHIAEELVFYRATGLEPRSNLDVDALRADSRFVDAFNEFAIANFARYILYLEHPDTTSLMGGDGLPTRGAVWSFLRYAADRLAGDDPTFFADLVNARSEGVANLNAALGDDAVDWMHDWAVSVYADDLVTDIGERFTQPSWNFRSILPEMGIEEFPLRTASLAPGDTAAVELSGGGAAFRGFRVESGRRAALLVTSDGDTPPGSLRGSLLRTR